MTDGPAHSGSVPLSLPERVFLANSVCGVNYVLLAHPMLRLQGLTHRPLAVDDIWRHIWKLDLRGLCHAATLVGLRPSLKDEYKARLVERVLPPSSSYTTERHLLSSAAAGGLSALTVASMECPWMIPPRLTLFIDRLIGTTLTPSSGNELSSLYNRFLLNAAHTVPYYCVLFGIYDSVTEQSDVWHEASWIWRFPVALSAALVGEWCGATLYQLQLAKLVHRSPPIQGIMQRLLSTVTAVLWMDARTALWTAIPNAAAVVAYDDAKQYWSKWKVS